MTYVKEEPKTYTNKYEKFRDLGWKSYEDGADVISFFCQHELDLSNKEKDFIADYNKNKLPKGVDINGRVKVVSKPDYKVEMPIQEVFSLIKGLMVTKNGTLRKSMDNLKPYEANTLASLLHYVREEWRFGERGNVILTFQEYYLLKPKKKSK